MLFVLKKWVGGLLMPLPLSLSLLFISVLLLFFSKHQTFAKCLTLLSFCILLGFSSLPGAQYLAQNLERQHPPLMNAEQSFDVILVLGSGGLNDTSLPITGQLSFTALSRFSEALRLQKANPNAQVIVSGDGFGDTKSHAQLMETLAITFGVPQDKITRLDNTKDTQQEVKIMSELIKNQKAALVTSATHMPRAMRLFKQYNQSPIPAPAMYLAKFNSEPLPAYAYIPSAYQLYKSQVAFHEYLGQLQNWVLH